MSSIQTILTPIFLTFGLLCSGHLSAQCGFSAAHVEKAALQSSPVPQQPTWKPGEILQTPAITPTYRSSMLLPRWTAEALPFFCRVEHDWVKAHGRVPLKFRLGSVEYVDWLEGKSFDQTRF